jgi:ornithine--oxo-acid transaminase
MASPLAKPYIDLETRYGAHNYQPLDLVIVHAEGCWVTDIDGKRYLDGLSGYSALNQGHRHPAIMKALLNQVERVTLTSRAFRNCELPFFEQELSELTGLPRVLPMNTGAEAVETAIKAARRWGYRNRSIPEDGAELIVCANNFHGRTTTLISASTEPAYRSDFGPFTPGFVTVPFGQIKALAEAIGPRTCAVLMEPIQAEAGVLIPPTGYLKEVSALCKRHNVLLMLDEIQTGLGRTGKMMCYQHEGILPDVLILGKALSGGYYPVSAMVARQDVMALFEPGSHGSTYGGNPLACAIARAALRVLTQEQLPERAATLGPPFLQRLRSLRNVSSLVRQVRGMGLLFGLELTKPARPIAEELSRVGILCKETHDNVLRFAPPLVIGQQDLDWAYARFEEVFTAQPHNVAA